MKKYAGQITRRYSKTLFELAVENRVVSEVAEQARAILKVLDDSVLSMLTSPRYSKANKKDLITVIVESVKPEQILQRFLELLLEGERFEFIKEILREYLAKADSHLGICRADVIMARAASQEDLGEIEKALSEVTKKKVILSSSVDEALKAGYIIKMGNTVVDASLRSRLASLKESLSQGV